MTNTPPTPWEPDRPPHIQDTPPRPKRSDTYAYQQNRAAILAASDICHICGEPGADAVDHVIPWAKGGTDQPHNLKPVHHNTPNSRGVKCNRVKGDRDPEVRLTTTRDW